MDTVDRTRTETQSTYTKADHNYWFNLMKEDARFTDYMIDIYKQQQLEKRKTINTEMSHQPPAITTRPLPKLMDQLIDHAVTQQQSTLQQQLCLQNRISMTPIDCPNMITMQTENRESATPRRPLDESGSEQMNQQRQVKKARPYEPTPSSTPIVTNGSSTARHYHFSQAHLKRAISNNLPVFYIKFETDTDNNQLISAMQVANWIRQMVRNQAQQTSLPDIEFSILVPSGMNRYKFGVRSLCDFLLLWNCNWPKEFNNFKVEILRPRALPDACALVVRSVPVDLPNEFVFQEIIKTIKSAVSFSMIKYYHYRSTNDFRFCVSDMNEFNEITLIGRIAIGNLLLQINPFIPSLKMTYCNKCWELGHQRQECNMYPRCRKCLERWDLNHKCQAPVLCAQCQGPHYSLSMECQVVNKYRQVLKDEVKAAINDGLIHKVETVNKTVSFNKVIAQQPSTTPNAKTSTTAWRNPTGQSQYTSKLVEHKQPDQVMQRLNEVLDVTSRTESKLDKQVTRTEQLEVKFSIMKQTLVDLSKIIKLIINALTEKKNKQQLTKLSRKLDDINEQIIENLVLNSNAHQSVSAGLSPSQLTEVNHLTKSTTATLSNDNSQHLDQEQSMTITDEYQ